MIATPPFRLVAGWRFFIDETTVPDAPGVYALLLSTKRLAHAGLLMESEAMPSSSVFSRHVPLYIGATSESMRGRLHSHVAGPTYRSTCRMALAALFRESLDLNIERMAGRCYFRIRPETGLTDWLVRNVSVAHHACPRPYPLEDELLRGGEGLLNVLGRPPTALTHRLRRARARYNGKTTVASGPEHSLLQANTAPC